MLLNYLEFAWKAMRREHKNRQELDENGEIEKTLNPLRFKLKLFLFFSFHNFSSIQNDKKKNLHSFMWNARSSESNDRNLLTMTMMMMIWWRAAIIVRSIQIWKSKNFSLCMEFFQFFHSQHPTEPSSSLNMWRKTSNLREMNKNWKKFR